MAHDQAMSKTVRRAPSDQSMSINSSGPLGGWSVSNPGQERQISEEESEAQLELEIAEAERDTWEAHARWLSNRTGPGPWRQFKLPQLKWQINQDQNDLTSLVQQAKNRRSRKPLRKKIANLHTYLEIMTEDQCRISNDQAVTRTNLKVKHAETRVTQYKDIVDAYNQLATEKNADTRRKLHRKVRDRKQNIELLGQAPE